MKPILGKMSFRHVLTALSAHALFNNYVAVHPYFTQSHKTLTWVHVDT